MRTLGQFTRSALFVGCAVLLPITARAESGFMNAGVQASFHEMGYASGGDIFTLTNTSTENAGITRIVIDTDPSLARVFFNPTGQNSSPYQVDAGVAAETGFLGFTNVDDNATQLILEFTDFNPGETFTFEVDIDDRFGWYVTGRDFSGTMLNAIFGTTESTAELFGAFEKGSNWSLAVVDLQGPAPIHDFANPEPSSMVLLCIGASSLGLQVWRKKRKSKSLRNAAA